MTKLKGLILTSLCLMLFVTLSAQQVTISPIPQSIKWGEKAFANGTSFNLKGEQTADADAVQLLKKELNISANGVEILIGKSGDATISEYQNKIPAQAEGYYLKVEPNRVVIAGRDNSGTFYGVQSLLQILSAKEVMSVEISDYPNVKERGIIEGYYGNPYSLQAKESLYAFMGANKMNVYIYGPKDDPYHGFSNKWRDPYPAAKAAEIAELIKNAHKNKVTFVWAVHPGQDISWDDKNGDGVIDDFKACVNKFELMYKMGARSFAVFFDDIGGIGAQAANQAKMLNYINANFVEKKHDVAPMLLCPTQYNRSWSGGDYLNILGTQMDKSVRIMWTGNSVVDMINRSDMDWINNQIKRKAYIWLNYPVNDYCVDHMLMGPTYGNDNNIDDQLSGFTSNPMEYAEASKVSLYSIADYTWNMRKYDANKSWLRAIKYLQPNNEAAFKIFCENNIDLGSTGHGLRRANESAPFKAVADKFMKTFNSGKYSQENSDELSAQFQTFVDAANKLSADKYNPALVEEIKPWLEVFKKIGEKGVIVLDMYKNLQTKDSVQFIENYEKYQALDKEMKTIRSRDFKGSIKSPFPKPANEVVVPFLNGLVRKIEHDYKSHYNYRNDLFPLTVLADGNYYIKVNGKLLTNRFVNANGGAPVFVNYNDSINPQRQEWTVTFDGTTGRYSIKNTQDLRYINELGAFGTNPYEAVWHTYNLFRFNGKFAVQNGGSAGTNFWKVISDKIVKSGNAQLTQDDFIFEFIPVGKEEKLTTLLPENNYYIAVNGKYLTNKTHVGMPRFTAKISDENSKEQLWKFEKDPTTNRMKISSLLDGRFIKQDGSFGKPDTYIANEHSYLMAEKEGFFFINIGRDNDKLFFFQSKYYRLTKVEQSYDSSYTFHIFPQNSTTNVRNSSVLNRFRINVEGRNLSVANKNIETLQLFSLDGKEMAKNNHSNSISLPTNAESAIYIVKISGEKGYTESQKILIK